MKACPAILILASLLAVYLSEAQEFSPLLNNYNRVLVNPSWAGSDMESGFSTSYTLYAGPNGTLFNETNFTYDQYSPELRGGMAFFLNQGLQAELNTNTIEMGLSYALRTKHSGNRFVPSLYISYLKPVKHWFVYGFDEWRNNYENYPNIPGKIFLRSDIYKLGTGGIFEIGRNKLGVYGYYGLSAKKVENIEPSHNPFRVVVFYSQKISEKGNGLLSQKKTISPEIFFNYGNNFFQVKSELLVESRKFIHSFFILNNFSDKAHFAGGTFGLNTKDIQLLFSNGFGIYIPQEKIVYNGTILFRLKLPKPWIKRLFPFKPLD